MSLSRDGAPDPPGAPAGAQHASVRDRARGALIGLAVGDAVGTTAEFSPRGSFPPVADMIGGGPFGLEPGQWTDDTSMALCLAESLVERGGFDPADQMDRYVRWWREGYHSSTGKHFDIGLTTEAALARYLRTGDPFAGSDDPGTAGNGSIMRLAPVPLFFAGDPAAAIARAADSSRTTHAAPVAVDACRYLGSLILGAVRGARKDELLAPRYCVLPGLWDREPLAGEIDRVAAGSFRELRPPRIRGTGYAAASLEAALWAFAATDDFRAGCLAAVNLGDDADTTAAVYGQLAGAFYGESGVPSEWRGKLALWPVIDALAEALSRRATGAAAREGDAVGTGPAQDAIAATSPADEWLARPAP